MQLDQIAVVRRTCDREAAPATVLDQEVEVLPWQKRQRLDGRQPQEHLHDVRSERHEPSDPARQCLDLDIGHPGDQSRLDGQVRSRARLAEQNVSGPRLLFRETQGPAGRIANLTRLQQRPAGAAVAGLATMRQIESGAQRRLEHGLVPAHAESAAVRLDAYAVVSRAHLTIIYGARVVI